MHRQIVHQDDVAAPECWDKTLLHISQKHRPIHSTLKHERCSHPALAQAGHKGDCFPMSMWRVTDQSLAAWTAASQPHHRSGGAGLIDKHQSRGIKHALLAHPTSPCAGHVGTLCSAAYKVFFKAEVVSFVEPHTAVRLPAILALDIASTTSSSVRSGCSVTKPSRNSA